jgi:hypothetical protein
VFGTEEMFTKDPRGGAIIVDAWRNWPIAIRKNGMSVMVSAGEYVHGTTFKFVNKPMLFRNSARPVSRKLMPKRFRFAQALKRIPGNVFYQSADL